MVYFRRGCVGAVHHDPAVIQVLACRRLKLGKSELLAHTILGDHRSCDPCRLLDVVCSTGRHGIENDLLRCASCDEFHQHRTDLRFRIEELLFLRNVHHVSQSTHRSRNDGDLLYRLGVLLQCGYQRVADFVVGNDSALFSGKNPVLLLLADQDQFNCFQQILLTDSCPVVLDREDRGLVDHVRKIRTHRSGG